MYIGDSINLHRIEHCRYEAGVVKICEFVVGLKFMLRMHMCSVKLHSVFSTRDQGKYYCYSVRQNRHRRLCPGLILHQNCIGSNSEQVQALLYNQFCPRASTCLEQPEICVNFLSSVLPYTTNRQKLHLHSGDLLHLSTNHS